MILNHVVRAICAWRRYRRCVNELSKLSDLELTDIGIARSAIMGVAWRTARDYITDPKSTGSANAPDDECD
jgi:uncharacterized protein YjiS (DUF1127 family)